MRGYGDNSGAIAERAREAAVHFEGKKTGCSQYQGAEWGLTLKATDLPDAIKNAPKGTRYIVALVAIGDDEEPVEQPKAEKERKRFEDMPASQQAGMLCNEEEFQVWLHNHPGWYGGAAINAASEDGDWTALSAVLLRQILGIKSRSELDTNEAARAKWETLKTEYKMATGRMASPR